MPSTHYSKGNCRIFVKSEGELNSYEILKLAKLNGEETVSHALYLLLEADEIPLSSCVKELLDLPPKRPEVFVSQPSLGIYDALYGSQTSLFMQEQRVVI